MEPAANNPTVNAPEKEQNKNRKVFRKKNQLVYIEYEVPKLNGHKITVMDSHRNILGRIHEHYDEGKDKFEYSFKDHEGKQIFAKDRLEDLKDSIVQGKEMLFHAAHQRRLERKKLRKEHGKSTTKQVEHLVERVSNESRDVLRTVTDFAGGEKGREAELQNIRKGKNRDKAREISI